MKKVYRALTKETVEKKWIGDTRSPPEGWFETPHEAVEEFAEKTPEKRGPGRPPKVFDNKGVVE